MSATFQPPPTWALPILVDEKSGKAIFNPVWLRWFIDLSANLGPGGIPVSGVYVTGAATANHVILFADATGTLIKDAGFAFGANVTTFLATPSSANLRTALTDETGTGAAVFANTPLLVTPKLTGYTVATLPVGTVGMRAYVTDALAPAFLVAVAGAGAVTCPVFYNGAAWVVG